MSLPDDMVKEILWKLPVKSVGRLSCVCKSWRDWITDPDFDNCRSKNSDPLLIFQKQPFVHFPFKCFRQILNPNTSQAFGPVGRIDEHIIGEVKEIGSCNGIICFKEYIAKPRDDCYWGCFSSIEKFRGFRVHLYNPITREYRRISHPLQFARASDSSDDRVFAFGFDGSSKDYKVLCIDKKHRTFETYNLRTDGDYWSKVNHHYDKYLNDNLKYFPEAFVYANDCCFWILSESRKLSYKAPEKMTAFSFRAEKFGHIKLPQMENVSSIDLGVLDNSVALCVSKTDVHMTEVWVRSKHGKKVSWMKKFSIMKAHLGSNLGAFWGHGTDVFQLMLSKKNGLNREVIALRTEEEEEHRNVRTRVFRFDCPFHNFTVFQPSLASLRSGRFLPRAY